MAELELFASMKVWAMTCSEASTTSMCSVSSSTLSWRSACSSRKSKKYLTAGGTARLALSTLRKKSSTNCCSRPSFWEVRSRSDRICPVEPGRHSGDERTRETTFLYTWSIIFSFT
ncbi:hypothetical protein CRUP_015250 [Coryphaenoides rupestris]|nr:hypothetical protein CRUP_015250 [Coryphaenoides rupestris]